MPIIINAWGEISTETVTNCFNHAIANLSRVNPIDKGFKPILREKNDSETEDSVPAYDDHYIDDESFLAKITTEKNKIEDYDDVVDSIYDEVGFVKA